MKAVGKELFALRSIGRLYCHNTRHRSETGSWQMACHLRQCDFPPTACALVSVLLHVSARLADFLILEKYRVEKKKKKQSEVCKCVCTHVNACGREGEVHREGALMHVGGVSAMLLKSHWKPLGFLLCYRALCRDSSTDLINLLLALFTQYSCCIRLQHVSDRRVDLRLEQIKIVFWCVPS